MPDLYTLFPDQIVLYGVGWCPDCRRAKRVFASKDIHFLEIDIDKDPKAEEFVKQHNRGYRSVPTIIFPDGSTLTEPDSSTLIQKLEASQTTA